MTKHFGTISDLLTQKTYKNSYGHDIDASEIDCITTYKHVIDGFYDAICASCGDSLGNRSCGWSIAGMVENCINCGKKNLFLRNDVEWINEQLNKTSHQDHKIKTLEKEVEELEQYRDSEPAKLMKRIGVLQGRLEEIKRLATG